MMLFNLYSCEESSYPSINNIESNELLTHLGKKVYINGDPTKVYTVGRMVSAVIPDIEFTSDAFNNVFTVTSIKVNGLQYVNTPISTTILKSSDLTTYINYMPNDTSDQNIGTYLGQNMIGTDGQPTTYAVPHSGLYLFLKNLIDNTLSIPIDIAKQNKYYFTTVYSTNLVGETSYGIIDQENLIFQKRDIDSFEIEYYYVDGNSSDSHSDYNNVRFKLVFDENQVAKLYEDGVESSLFNPLFSFDQVSVIPNDETTIVRDILNPIVVNECTEYTPYYDTSISVSTCDGIDDCCDSISFTDSSTISNTFAGHSTFGYRLIRVIRPDGTVYEYSSAVSDEPDQSIQVLYAGGINDFTYQFNSTDIDGIYEVQLYNFPEWNGSTVYNSMLNIIVHENDKLWKCIASNSNVSPSSDLTNQYWIEYDLDATTIDTRYGFSIKSVVICISLIGCYKKLIEDAFCSDQSNPCAPLCENKKFMNSMKVRVLWDAVKVAECNKDYIRVNDLIQTWKSICSCVTC